MGFTYSGDPGSSPNDAVRFAIGDTNPATFYMQDGEVAYCLQMTNGDTLKAAVIACEAIIAKLGPMCDQTVGSVSKSFSQQSANFKAILANLRRAALGTGGVPFVGGTSRIANLAPYGNPDQVRPQFTTHMMTGRHGHYAGAGNYAITGQVPTSYAGGYPYTSGNLENLADG